MLAHETPKTTSISARGISKVYCLGDTEDKVIDDLNLEIKATEFVSITGPSGSGKSTLLNLLGLMDAPTKGEIFFNGSLISEDSVDSVRRERIGFIFQNFNLFSALTARENVEFSLLGLETSEEKMKALSLKALERVGMTAHEHKFPHQLSGGQRQRVAIARAFVHSPSLIVADELTASLDRKNAEAVIELLKNLHNELKTTVLLASHDKEVYEKANRILKLEKGKLVG